LLTYPCIQLKDWERVLDNTSGTQATALYRGRIASFTGTTAADKLQELIDREKIVELTAIYAHRMAHGVSVADLFTDDGAYINRGTAGVSPREIRGRTMLDEYYGDRDVIEPPLPMLHNHLIEIDGDTARGLCSMELRLGTRGVSMVGSGTYEDSFRRVDGTWFFTERVYTYFHWVPLHQGWARPAGEDPA
jgi:hypothetical protein